MNRRLLLALAAVLAVGACNEQQEPNTGGSNPGDFASTSGTIGINVVLKARATAANRTELAKYGTLLDEIAELNAIRVRAKSDQLPAIQALPFVKSATPDAARNAAPIDLVSAEDFLSGANAWDQDAINVTDFGAGRTLPNGYNGDGVNVAILDTGLLPTWQQYFPQERIRVDYAKTFGGGGQDNLNVSEPPNKWEADVNSHGTHVTSTILGYQFPGLGQFNGVAPLTKIIPVKVLNQNGSGWSSAIARGINYVADLKRNDPLLKGSPMVINMSLGGGSPDALEQAAIDDAIAAGVIIVASAGNNGDAGMGWPGAFPEVISAAASGWSKQFVSCAAAGQPSNAGGWWRACDYPENTSEVYIANFSAREKPGQDLDVVAPGSWVVGPYQTNQSNKMSLFFLSGTSMASPHVAGIVALMAQQNPSLTASQAEATLESRATPLAKGCATVINEAEQQCWDTDATGSGLITATAALGLSTGGRRR